MKRRVNRVHIDVKRVAVFLIGVASTSVSPALAQDDPAPMERLSSGTETDDEGAEWLTVEHPVAGRRSWYVGLGYEMAPLRNLAVTTRNETGDESTVMRRGLSHVQLHVGGGWAIAGRFRAMAHPGQRTRIRGNALYFHFLGELGIPVGSPTLPVYLTLGGQLQYVLARTRHAFMTGVSGGARWDLSASKFGGELAVGVGYAFILPKVPLPVWLQGVWHTAGALSGDAFGFRVMFAWALGT